MMSAVALVAGDVRIAPSGIVELFPREPPRVTLVKNLKLSPPFDQGVLARTLSGTGAVIFVFDLAPGQAKARKALVVDFTVNTRSESLFVEIDKW